ncbi:MAG: hypothetical protein JWO36_3167 [Myxococcales bacterium]|nr:hypothetical protein [Myxococcales bacterium]
MGPGLFALERASEAIEAVLPQPAVLGEPRVELPERLRPQRVEPSLSVRTHRDEAGLVQNAEVARDAGLVDPGVLDDVADLLLPASKHLDDAPPRWIGKCLEGV